MGEWSTNKGRMEEEINKKNEVSTFGSNFGDIGHKDLTKVKE